MCSDSHFINYSHLIPSHPIPSHLISSHPIPSHPVSSHLISSHPIPSHPIPSHLISSHLINESKLYENTSDQMLSLNGYKIVRRDRNKHGGGVCVYVREEKPSEVLTVYILGSRFVSLKEPDWQRAINNSLPNVNTIFNSCSIGIASNMLSLNSNSRC